MEKSLHQGESYTILSSRTEKKLYSDSVRYVMQQDMGFIGKRKLIVETFFANSNDSSKIVRILLPKHRIKKIDGKKIYSDAGFVVAREIETSCIEGSSLENWINKVEELQYVRR
jgi:hypothetical protein